MKKLFLVLLVAVVSSGSAWAQKGMMGVGANVAMTAIPITEGGLGIGGGVKFQYNISDYFRIEPSFTYYANVDENKTTAEMAGLVNLHAFLSSPRTLRPYIFVGGGYVRINGIENGIFVIDRSYDSDQLCAFIPTSNDSSKYVCVDIMYAGADGFVKTEIEKEIEVILLPTDVIRIVPTNTGEILENDDPTIEDNRTITFKDISVEDYYKLALDSIIASDDADFSIYGYQYDLNNIGDTQGYYADYVSAVKFDDGKIIVNYKNGGV